MVIAGPDDVAFNVIGFDPRYAESLRRGTLLHSIYQEGAGYCRVHRCCDDIVEMERENDGLRFELAELRERLRRLNRDSANGRK